MARLFILALAVTAVAYFVLRSSPEGAAREKALRTGEIYLTALVEGPPEEVNELTCRDGRFGTAPGPTFEAARRKVAGDAELIAAEVSDDPVTNVSLRNGAAYVRGTAQTSNGDVDLRLHMEDFLGVWLVCGIKADRAS